MRRTEKSMILGITGGVGTGKSTVLAYLKEQYGAFLIQLDDVARQLQQSQEACYGPMLELFGIRTKHPDPSRESAGSGIRSAHDTLSCQRSMLLNEDGTFNRSAVAKLVFADDDLRRALNRIVHPAVKQRVRELIDSHKDAALIVIEAALLLEDHYEEICDEIWFVYAEESVRRERLKKSRGYTDGKISEMLASQRSDESYQAGCSLTIDNSSENIENTYRQLDEALGERGFWKAASSHSNV